MNRFPRVLGAPLTAVVCLAVAVPAQQEGRPQLPPQRQLDSESGPWRTVRSGEGLRATVFGIDIDLPSRDRSTNNSYDAGFASVAGADDAGFQPNASIYVWRHYADGELLRGVFAGVYDDVWWTLPGSGVQPVLTFTNDTLPFAVSEHIDGDAQDPEQLKWGYLRAGIGIGSRTKVGPQDDNLMAFDLLLEPGLLYFARGDRTDPAFVTPDTTFELRTHLRGRYDRLERNLLELPHEGFCAGADVVWGFRAKWSDWGLPGTETHSGDSGRDYVSASGYALVATGVPLVDSERDRVIASVHAGAGDSLDRFSAQRIGGGPDRRGIEYDTTTRPLLPGATTSEFFPEHYAIGAVGYRRELTFFMFLAVDGTAAWLDRDRQQGGGRVRQDDSLLAASARLSSGFFGSSRFQLGYAHNFDVIRDGERGGNEILLQVTGRF